MGDNLKNKKILCHINNMGRGGAERVMSVLIDNMLEEGAQIVLVTLDRAKDEYAVSDKVKRIEIDSIAKASNAITRFMKRVLQLRKIIKEQKPDLVLSFCSKENLRSSLAMSNINIPLLVSVRSNPSEHYGNNILRTIIENRADGWVFQSKGAKAYFSKKSQTKSRIIANPIDKAYFEKKVTYDGNDDEIRIVTAGRLTRAKNHIQLVNSFKMIADDFKDANLYIYGKDDKDGSSDIVNAAIADSSCADRIHLMGPCSTWPDEIVKADIFVMSSIFEGMPNALLEAMVVGLPVISTDCPSGGPADVINDGENGRLVPMNELEPMAEAIRELIADKQKRESYGTKAMEVRALVDTEAICNQWKDYMLTLMQ